MRTRSYSTHLMFGKMRVTLRVTDTNVPYILVLSHMNFSCGEFLLLTNCGYEKDQRRLPSCYQLR